MRELSGAEANRRFYAARAEEYDATEPCVAHPRERARLRGALQQALALAGPEARALDACGGSGNASLLLAELGAAPVTVDVSPEMLALYERKASERGLEPETHAAPIEDFLRTETRSWDLIVFSSALHHLDDPGGVLELAAARLAPGGVLLTIFDPTRLGRAGRALRLADYGLHLALRHPRRLPRALARRRHHGGDEVGLRAERHALAGLDDRALAERLRATSLELVAHERRYEARYGVVRLALRALREPSSFALLAHRPG